MKRAISLAVACSVLAVSLPRVAHAEEPDAVVLEPISAPIATPPRIFLSSSELMGRPEVVPVRLGLLNPPALREIKLSEGAKTAIIIGAIIVGVLIIVGVAVVVTPGKKPPKP